MLLSATGVALANHYVYRAEDPNQQVPAQGTENWVFRWWGLGTTSLWWWADSSLHSDANTVKTNWTAVVPELTWMEVSSEADADVSFKAGSCPAGAPACVSTSSYFYESDRNGDYWERATVYVDLGYDWSPAGRRGAMAHEAGHLYGLHERYLDTSGNTCNNNETTVMDGSKEPVP